MTKLFLYSETVTVLLLSNIKSGSLRFVPHMMALLVLFGCRKAENKMSRLTSSSTGIDFVNALDPTGDLNIIKYLYYYNGGGVAVGDINNDGLEDLFFTANQGDDQLYLNTGNLQFRNITQSAGITNYQTSWSNGVVFADVNGDGWEDIYICKVGNYLSLQGHNLLYLNNQDNTFREVAEEVGLAFSGFSTHAAFFDYDRDGDLDMYLMNHAVHTTRSYQDASTRQIPDPFAGDRLYQNQMVESDSLFFKDVTQEAGIYSSAQGYGLGLVTADINQDGWMDIYVGNDFHEDDYLYLNQKDGTFKESRSEMISHTSRFTMGVDIADVNGDTHPDIFSLDMLPRDEQILMKSGGEDNNKVTEVKLKFGYGHQYARNAFQLNTGRGTFSEVALLTDTYATDWSWSVLLQDYDNDGLKDIFITNGIFKRPNDLDYINFLSTLDLTLVSEKNQDSLDQVLIQRMPTLKIPNYLFRNTGDLGFEEVSKAWGLGEPSYSNGAAYADLDNDGDLELVINNVNSEAFIYQNNFNGHYLQIKLVGDSYNQQALGSTVRVWYGGKEVVGEVVSSRGFQSASTKRLHFGLGDETRIDSLTIHWPDGAVRKLGSLRADSLYTIRKESSDAFSLANNDKIRLSYLEPGIVENDYRDYDKETLILEKLSTEGPAAVAADFNGDGMEDLFLGTPRSQHHLLYLQTKEGLGQRAKTTFANSDQLEAVDAAAFDFDDDGDLDLYVVHGGNDYPYDSPYFEDALYLNDGKANFEKAELTLPSINGSCVASGDYDNDGDPDLFVGGRSVPGGYGLIPESLLIENKEGTLKVARVLTPGMVTDAAWHDFDGDGDLDLFVVGDWMPVTVLRNDGNADFKDITEDIGLGSSHGMWNNIVMTDVNQDGQKDIVLGNLGLNSKLKASSDQPVTMFLDDFDRNGQPDPIIFYHINGSKIPFASRDELAAQLPYLKKDFLSYSVFSQTRTLKDLTGKDEREVAQVNYLHDLSSGILLWQNGKYIKQDFPLQAQFSPINDILATDLDDDGLTDLIYVGNFFGAVTSVGRYDASPGGILKGTGGGKYAFKGFLPLDFDREYRKVITLNNGKFVMVPNSGKPVILDKNELVESSFRR